MRIPKIEGAGAAALSPINDYADTIWITTDWSSGGGMGVSLWDTLEQIQGRTDGVIIRFDPSLHGHEIPANNRKFYVDDVSKLWICGSDAAVAIWQYGIQFRNCDHVVVSDMTFAPGNEGPQDSSIDGLSFLNCNHVAVANCSIHHSCDEGIDFAGTTDNYTLQDTAICNPLDFSGRHVDTAPADNHHAFACRMASSANMARSTCCRNYFDSYRIRGPQYDSNAATEQWHENYNNVFYNWIVASLDGGTEIQKHHWYLEGNTFRTGPSLMMEDYWNSPNDQPTPTQRIQRAVSLDGSQSDVYEADNWVNGINRKGEISNYGNPGDYGLVKWGSNKGTLLGSVPPWVLAQPVPAVVAEPLVCANAGAWYRDPATQELKRVAMTNAAVERYRTNTGQVVDEALDVGGIRLV